MGAAGCEPDNVRLRPATMEDARLLFDWVNSAASLEQKRETREPVPWADHCHWLQERLARDDCLIEIIEVDGAVAGQVRIEPKAGGPHVDIFIAPDQRRRNLARTALQDALARVTERPVIAEVKTGNAASRALFAGLGFDQTARSGDFITFALKD